jgi:hypothetical protein
MGDRVPFPSQSKLVNKDPSSTFSDSSSSNWIEINSLGLTWTQQIWFKGLVQSIFAVLKPMAAQTEVGNACMICKSNNLSSYILE